MGKLRTIKNMFLALLGGYFIAAIKARRRANNLGNQLVDDLRAFEATPEAERWYNQ